MIHPIPSGTRDVLPDEMRELRAITDALRAVFERHGYGEVYTPALEYESVLARAAGRAAARLPRVRRERRDRAGAALGHDRADRARRRHALRRRAELPLRFCYFAHCYRGIRPQRGPAARVAAGRHRADRLAGARRHRRGADRAVPRARRDRPDRLPRRPRRRLAVPGAAGAPRTSPAQPAPALLEELARRRLRRASSSASSAIGLPEESAELLLGVPQRRGGPEVLDGRPARRPTRSPGMREVHELLEPGVAARVIFDLGLVRTSATTRAPCSRSTTRRSACRSAAAGATTSCSAGSAPPAGGRVRAGRRTAAQRARRGGARDGRAAPMIASGIAGASGPPMSADGRPDDRRARAARCSAGRSTGSTASGLDTEELRTNDRKLLFEDIGVITMRPSDVPTYVAAGAADLGITGKDVLLEQAAQRARRRRARRLRAARPRLRALHDGRSRPVKPARTRPPRRCAGSA